LKVKILALCCSQRKEGNTEFLLSEILKGAQQEGAETELYRVSGKNIQPCDGCHACMKTGQCHLKDDMQEIYSKILESKGIIFGAPSYFYGMAGQAKNIIDRTTCLNQPGRSMANKVGSVTAVGGSLGLADILKDIYFYMITKQMIPANFLAGYGLQKGDTKNLENGIKAARDVGRQMVKIAAKGFEYPSDIRGSHFGYGTWNK
jgi:multimeric flavodoxin WrbA